MHEVSAGVRATIARWGRQKRRIWSGHSEAWVDSKGLRKVHWDGYAASFMGKLMEERDGCGQGARRQFWDEVMWGDGLDVQRVLPGMEEEPFVGLHLKYVFDPEFGLTMERKARLVGWGLTKLKHCVTFGEQRIALKLGAATQPVELVTKIICEALQFPRIAPINSQAGRATPALNLAALNRPKLSIAG